MGFGAGLGARTGVRPTSRRQASLVASGDLTMVSGYAQYQSWSTRPDVRAIAALPHGQHRSLQQMLASLKSCVS